MRERCMEEAVRDRLPGSREAGKEGGVGEWRRGRQLLREVGRKEGEVREVHELTCLAQV